ncbi:uncharacterized protein PFL1_04700 [Pseudozyma flocculosa PF-1]|uniref:DSBA-like thioredoxin domain-containing protein n=1 Tax=Pseudozyma flocculosa PF-1 TaxID=1277687 RepID=A0A061H402_9BASI|nr:uncharacterized protein PFL1_04700 [Pseudozyma flocculosa PF-1]EPQ27562.1 hypothetical protein PFL1_04700 [Pseudozyma flocculosa PF-1]
MASSKPEMLLQMYTDVQCPWCWIGSQRFKQFLASPAYRDEVAPHVRTVVRIEPYLLDSRLPATSYDTPDGVYDALSTTPYDKNKPPSKKEYYGTKFGAGLDAFDRRISAAATEVGLPPFDWHSEDGKVGATWDCHRLVLRASNLDDQDPQLADGDPQRWVHHSRQLRLMDRLYADFHANSRDMSDRSYLAPLAAELGLFDDEAAAAKWLASDEAEYELRNKLKIAEMNGVMQIPFYIVNDGADHLTGWTGDHAEFLRVMKMQVAAFAR